MTERQGCGLLNVVVDFVLFKILTDVIACHTGAYSYAEKNFE